MLGCPLFFLFLTALILPSIAKEDPVDLIKRHRYEEAISIWDKDIDLNKIDEKGLRALKGKSLAYFRLGTLYNLFQGFSNAIMTGYYSDHISETGGAQHYLYLGQIQYQGGKFSDAKSSFEKAKKLGRAGLATSELADLYLFYSKKKLGEVTGEYSQALKDNAAVWQLLDLKGSSAAEIPSKLLATGQRSHRCKLSIQLRGANPSISEIEQSLKMVLDEAQNPEAFLDQGKNTQINFYDPFLLESLSRAYFTLAKLSNLKIQEQEKNFSALAGKFNTAAALAGVQLKLGASKEAFDLVSAATNLEAQLLKARALAAQNKIPEAKAILEGAAASSKSPADRRDIADCYYLLGFDLDKGLKLAGQAIHDKEGPNYYRTYANLLLASGQIEPAMQQFAKGYKIEYRNRIDQIDPEYMIDYSFAIFKNNKLRYEEIVETLYHLQKEFPACRQMHYCIQGISAGLARSFESQRIFRKGG